MMTYSHCHINVSTNFSKYLHSYTYKDYKSSILFENGDEYPVQAKSHIAQRNCRNFVSFHPFFQIDSKGNNSFKADGLNHS